MGQRQLFSKRRVALYVMLVPIVYLLVKFVVAINRPITTVSPTQAAQPIKMAQAPVYEKPTPQRLLELTNAERAKVGVKPLIMDGRLNRSAQKKADELAATRKFSHLNSDGINTASYIGDVAPECKYGSENLLANTVDVNIGFDWWMHSASHKAALIDARYEYVGLAVNGGYVAQHFCDID